MTLGSFDPFTACKVLVVATGFSKHLHERRLTLLVVAGVFAQSGFDDLARNRIVPDVLGSGADPGVQQQHDCRSRAKLRWRGQIRHIWDTLRVGS